MASVVIAGEHHSLLALEENPPRKMDRANAPEVAAAEHVAREVIDQPQNDREKRAAVPARLYASKSCELIGDVVILEGGQLQDVINFRAVNDLGLRLFVVPQHPQEHGGGQDGRRDQQRKQDEQRKEPESDHKDDSERDRDEADKNEKHDGAEHNE